MKQEIINYIHGVDNNLNDKLRDLNKIERNPRSL